MLITMNQIRCGGLLILRSNESYLKEMARELKLIRIELQKQNEPTIKEDKTKENKTSKYI